MMKNKKRLANVLGAAMVTILLWAVFAMLGQGLAPRPSSGEFNLATWTQQVVQAQEDLSEPESHHHAHEEGERATMSEEGEHPYEVHEGEHEETHKEVEEHEAYEGHEEEDHE